MSRRRRHQRTEKARRHGQPARWIESAWPTDSAQPIEKRAVATPPRVAVRQASRVERLAYTRSQAAQALGISPSTLRRLLPHLETIELPWGSTLIPVDELERLLTELRRAPRSPAPRAVRGRPPHVQPELAERIRSERAAGKSLRRIAADLNAAATPTAQGGERWWPSTVRAVLLRADAATHAS